MAYGWITEVADKAYNRAQDLRPEKNLQHNRELTARARQEAEAAALRRYEEEVASRNAPTMPSLTAAPMGSDAPLPGAGEPLIPNKDQARAQWDMLHEDEQALNAELLRASSENPDALNLPEFQARRQKILDEKARAARVFGPPPIGSKAYRIEVMDEISKGQKPMGGAITESQASGRRGATDPMRRVAEGYLADKLLEEGPDTRRDQLLVEELTNRRNQVMPSLWGTEGAGDLDSDIAAVTQRLSGKDATKLEIAKLNVAGKLSTSAAENEVRSAKVGLDNRALDLKAELGREANRLRGMAIEQKDRKLILEALWKQQEAALKNLVSIRQYAGTIGGLYRDASTGRTITTDQLIAQAERQVAALSSLGRDVNEGVFRTGDDLERAVSALGDLEINPGVDRSAVTTPSEWFGFKPGEEKMPALTAAASPARAEMRSPVALGGRSGVMVDATGAPTTNFGPLFPATQPPKADKPPAPPKGAAAPPPALLTAAGKALEGVKPGQRKRAGGYLFWKDSKGKIQYSKE